MRAERGFTLLELLVAFVIAALALGALFNGASGGLRSVAVSNRYQEALSRARSRLATVGHGLILAPLHQSGDDGSGFHWTLEIEVTDRATPQRQPANDVQGLSPHIALYSVQVSESWMGDSGPRHVSLQTERVALTP